MILSYKVDLRGLPTRNVFRAVSLGGFTFPGLPHKKIVIALCLQLVFDQVLLFCVMSRHSLSSSGRVTP